MIDLLGICMRNANGLDGRNIIIVGIFVLPIYVSVKLWSSSLLILFGTAPEKICQPFISCCFFGSSTVLSGGSAGHNGCVAVFLDSFTVCGGGAVTIVPGGGFFGLLLSILQDG